MFGKKISCILGLWVLLNNVNNVLAGTAVEISICDADLDVSTTTDCSGYDTNVATEYCVKGLKIYGIYNGDAVCKEDLTASSVKLYKLDGNSIVEQTLGSGSFSSDKAKLAIIHCNTSECKQTPGIVKDSTTFYSIFDDDSKTNDADAGTACTATTAVGKLASDKKLCLKENAAGDASATKASSNGSYLLSSADSGSVFGSGSIIVKVTDNYIIHDNLDNNLHVFKNFNEVAFTVDGTIIGLEDRKNLHAYHCKDGACTETFGYIKMGNTDGYYRLINGGDSEKVTNGQNTCTSKDYGDFDTTGSNFCLGEKATVPMITGDATTFTLIPNKKANIFSAAGSDDNNIMLYSTKYALVLDNFNGVDSEKYIIKSNGKFIEYSYASDGTKYTVAQETGTKIAEKLGDGFYHISDLNDISDKTKIGLFNCKSGSCKQTVGYISNDGNTFYTVSLTGSSSTTEIDCSSGNIGKLDTSNKLCLTSSGSDNDVANFLLNVPTGNASVFGIYAGKSIVISISDSSKSIVYNNYYSTGPLLIDKTTTKEADISGDISGSKTNLELYICNGDGICSRALGYIKDGATSANYISISKTDSTQNKLSSEDEVNFVTDCTSSSNAGKIKNDDFNLCVGDSGVTYPSADGHLVVHNGSNYIFIRTTDNGLITKEQIEVSGTGTVLINKNTLKKLDFPATAANIEAELDDLVLYYCDTSKKECKQTYGYIKSSDAVPSIYAISKTKNTLVTGADDCTEIGSILADSGKLCIDAVDDHAVDFISDSSIINYALVVPASNIFTESDSSTDSILIQGVKNVFFHYTYGITENSKKYLIKIDSVLKKFTYTAEGTKLTPETTDGVMAVEKIVDGSIYIEAATLADTNYLYHCREGDCIPTVGYIVVGSGGSETLMKCSSNGCSSTPASSELVDSCADGSYGKIKLDTTIKSCITGSDFTDVDNTKIYIVGSGTSYKKFVGNLAKTILEVSDPDGYYLIKTDDIEVEAAADTAGTLLSCIGGTCTESTTTGSYPNAGGDLIIKCDEEGSCKLKSDATVGYQLSVNKDLIYCSTSSKCLKVEAPSGYYIDVSTAGKVIFCDPNEQHKCTGITGITSKGYGYLDSSDLQHTKVITCPGGGGACTSAAYNNGAAGVTQYVIDASNPKNLISCPSGGKCVSIPANTGYSLYTYATDTDYTINCSAALGGCTSAKALSQCVEESTTNDKCQNEDEDLADGYYLSSSNGKIYKSSTSACREQPDGKIYIFQKKSSTPSYVDVDSGDTTDYIIYSCSSGKCTQMVDTNYLDVSKGILYSCGVDGVCSQVANSVVGYYASGLQTILDGRTDYGYGGLIQCTSTSVSSCINVKNEKGFYINSESGKSIIACDGSQCTQLNEADYTKCTGRIGSLKIVNDGGKKYYLCKTSIDTEDDTNQIEIMVGASTSSVDLEVAANIFPGISEASSISVVIDSDGSAAIKTGSDDVANIVCNVTNGNKCKDGTYTLVDTDLYYCPTEDLPCESINEVGYYISDAEHIYYCQIVDLSLFCGLTEAAETCDSNTIGKLIYTDNKFSICLVEGVEIELSSSNSGDYALGYRVGNIFGITTGTSYAIITVGEKSVTLNSNYDNGRKFAYVDVTTTGKFKFMTNTSMCPTNKEDGMIELECTNGICSPPS